MHLCELFWQCHDLSWSVTKIVIMFFKYFGDFWWWSGDLQAKCHKNHYFEITNYHQICFKKMVTFHDTWKSLVSFDDIWVSLMTKPRVLSWRVMKYNEFSLYVVNNVREAESSGLADRGPKWAWPLSRLYEKFFLQVIGEGVGPLILCNIRFQYL